VEQVQQILEQGTGADRQLKIHEETNDLKSVAQYINQQFLQGI